MLYRAQSAAKIDALGKQNSCPFELFATWRVPPAEQVAPSACGDEIVSERRHACQLRLDRLNDETSLFPIEETRERSLPAAGRSCVPLATYPQSMNAVRPRVPEPLAGSGVADANIAIEIRQRRDRRRRGFMGIDHDR